MNILKTEDMVESPWITPKRLIYENDKGQVLNGTILSAAARGDIIGGGPWYMLMAMKYL